MENFSFDVNDVEDFDLSLPESVYEVAITSCEMRQSNNNPNTWMIATEYTLDGNPEHDGRKVMDYFVVAHEKANIAARGKSDLKGLVLVLGLKGFKQPSDLVGGRLRIKTKNNKDGFANVHDRLNIVRPSGGNQMPMGDIPF